MLLRILLFGLLLSHAYGQQTAHTVRQRLCREVNLSYLLYVPRSYSMTVERLPLLMYLHGGSLRGDSLAMLRRMGLPQQLENKPDFPFVVIAPQCPKGEIWTDTDRLIAVLDEVVKNYRIDTTRIYLTGHSMGGRGTWYLAYKHPERFAAIAPMSAFFTIEEWITKLKRVPVWVFHGAKDEAAPVSESRRMVDLLQKAGGQVKYTEYPDRDHFILDTYENQALYDWLLAQRK